MHYQLIVVDITARLAKALPSFRGGLNLLRVLPLPQYFCEGEISN